jgi:hypothetical protein
LCKERPKMALAYTNLKAEIIWLVRIRNSWLFPLWKPQEFFCF